MESKLDGRPAGTALPTDAETGPYTLADTPGLTAAMLKKLHAGGITSPSQVLQAGLGGLVNLPGIGEKSAQKIMGLVKDSADL